MALPSTIVAAVVLMALVVVGLLSGYLLTGKIKLKKGCGSLPDASKKECPLCGTKKKCDDKKE